MSFTLPKPVLSTVTAAVPDFSAASDAARVSGATTQKAERSTFDTLLARHKDEAQAPAKTETKAETKSADAPKVQKFETQKPAAQKTTPHASARHDTPKAVGDKAQKDDSDPTDTSATATVAADEGKTATQADETQTATATTASDDSAATDPAVQAQGDASVQTQTSDADAATLAAQAQIQAQLQTQLQAQSQPQPQSQTPVTPDDAAQLAALPQGRPVPKGPQQPAPAAPDDAVVDDAAQADDKKVVEAQVPVDATFAALLSQVAPAQGGANSAAPIKTGKTVASATDKPAAASPAELTLKSGPAADKTADTQVKLAEGQGANLSDASAGTSGDRQASAFPAIDTRDASQTTVSLQTSQTQATAQSLPDPTATAQVVPSTQSPATTPSPFSIQTTAADVSGGYSATGAQTASATTLSRSAIENMGAMGVQIAKKLSEGNTKFALELHPADLGKVEVALNIGRDGKTTAHLRFDTPVTAAAFSAHEGELRQQLADAGLTVDSDALSFSSRDGDGANSGQAFAQMYQGQEQASHGRAARALQSASDQADQIDADTALDTALAEFRNRPANSTLALNLVV